LNESCNSKPKSRNLKLDEMGSGACFISFARLTPNFVQFKISDFGFELQDSFNLRFPHLLSQVFCN